MTKAEKEHKLKLITLILLVKYEYARRNQYTSIGEVIDFAMDTLLWIMEYRKVQKLPTYEKGCS